MPSVINTNLASQFAQNSLSGAQSKLATSVQRLSSGLRINSAKDDAAGLSVAQNMQSQINAVNMAARNIGDATNVLTTADSSLGTIQDILLRMKTLAVEGKNDGLSGEQRRNIYEEVNQLNKEISSISTKTTFNGNSLLSATNNLTAAGTTGLVAGIVGSSAGTNSVVTAVAVSQPTVVSTGIYTLTSVTATTLKMSNGSNDQTVTLAANATIGNNVLDFSTFGIKLTFTSSATDAAALTTAAFNTDVITVTGSNATLNFQSGASQTNDTFTFNGLDTRTESGTQAIYLDVETKTAALALLTTTGTANNFNTAFQNLSTSVDAAINKANTDRAVLGAQMNRLGYISTALMSQSTNISASRSAVIDTDFAAETAMLTRGQIMQQAATAMLAQANQMPNVILSLLK
jgi:flagellin